VTLNQDQFKSDQRSQNDLKTGILRADGCSSVTLKVNFYNDIISNTRCSRAISDRFVLPALRLPDIESPFAIEYGKCLSV